MMEEIMARIPTDPYDPEWAAFNQEHPSLHKSVGAAADPAPDPEPDPDPAPDPDPEPTPDPDPAPSDDWRSDLPDDLKKTAERFTSKEDAVRALSDFRKRESQVRVPGKNASEDEISAYHKAIGVPEDVKGYEFPDLPEGVEMNDNIQASREAWAARFKDLSVPTGMAKELARMVNEDEMAVMKAQVDADKEFAKSQEDALRDEWKGDFDTNKTLANRALADITNRAGVDLDALTKIETKDGRFLMDRAEIARMFAAIGRDMSEGGLGPVLSESEADTIEEEVRDVRKQIAEAQAEGDSKRANKLFAREQSLLAKIKGSEPVVGAGGRSI